MSAEDLCTEFAGNVISIFAEKIKSKGKKLVFYTGHAVEEMSNDNITTELLETCMVDQPELIEFHWEYPFPSVKAVFLCAPKQFPPFHVICLCFEGSVTVKTAYIVTLDKYETNNKTRIRKKR